MNPTPVPTPDVATDPHPDITSADPVLTLPVPIIEPPADPAPPEDDVGLVDPRDKPPDGPIEVELDVTELPELAG